MFMHVGVAFTLVATALARLNTTLKDGSGDACVIAGVPREHASR